MISIAIVCLVFLGVGALILWMPTLMRNADGKLKSSGTFLVKKIVIKGNHRCSRSEIIQALGLDSRQLIFSFSLARARKRIKSLPYVKQVRLYRRLPDQLRIVIEERQPIALLYLEKLYMVDEEGVVIGRVPQGESLDFPVISGVSVAEWRKRPQVWGKLLKKATGLLKLWNERGHKWSEKVAQVELDEACGVTLYTTGCGWELQLGLDDYRERLSRWRQVVSVLGEKAASVKYFDCAGESSVVAGLQQVQ